MTNRLAQSQSLYLRKHADNPVDWWSWSDEAIATARQTHRPIFLSIGYSSCHWCTVMEREAFSNDEIAAYLNAHFIPIKVDREERPDLDSRYMQALQLMTGQRGWPLNVFLFADDLIPFYGGTYFPVEARYGKPALLKVLKTLHTLCETDLGKLTTITSQVSAELAPSQSLLSATDLTESLLHQGIVESAKVLLPTGTGASFPMIPYALTALQSRLIQSTSLDLYQICRQRSHDLSLGGIFDHVAGGFHRYTVDPTWTVPHFEKMLYDSGLIMEFLSGIALVESERRGETILAAEPAVERAIALTVEWLVREMAAPDGYFYAAQDADSSTAPDSEPEEGAFYVWSRDELLSLLNPEELTALEQSFIIESAGNFEGATVLQRRESGVLSVIAQQAITKLFQARYGPEPARTPPVTDTKLIVAWNALTISGLAKAATALNRADYLALAVRAAQFILRHQWSGSRLHRLNYNGQAAVLAQSEDYAFLTKALLDIHQASLAFDAYVHQASDWLDQALRLQAEQDKWFWSEQGGYFDTASDLRDSFLGQERAYRDSSTPAANGISVANLVRLSLLSENLDYFNRAEQSLKAFSTVMQKEPLACPSLFQALDWFQNSTLVHTSVACMPALFKRYLPTVVFAATPDLPEGAVGLVCKGAACLEPAMDLAQLQEQIISG